MGSLFSYETTWCFQNTIHFKTTSYNIQALSTLRFTLVWLYLKGTFGNGCDALYLFGGTSNVGLSLVLPISKPFGSSFNMFKFKNLST